jgi:1-acyl-sn-glycerol-3-phosphate acyltransferase
MREASHSAASTIEVVAGSLTFRLRAWGPPDAPTVLLLGHVPDVPFSLDGLAAALSEAKAPRRVLVPERIDIGPDARFFAIADDLAKLVAALDCGRVEVVGAGFGGTVAVHLGSSAPRLVRAIALLDSPLPNLHGVDLDLARRLAEAYAYVADFLDPRFEASLAAGAPGAPEDGGLLTQFWERAPWWPEQEARFRAEFTRPEFAARVAAAYRANYTLVDAGGTFTAADEERVSAFGRRTAAIRAGEPRRLVAPVLAPQPVVLEVPSLYYASCPRLLPPEVSDRAFLGRYLRSPRVVLGNASALGAHVGDPEGVAAVVAQFFTDVAEASPVAQAPVTDPAREARDSQYIVDRYDEKIRSFRAPAVGEGRHALRGSHPKPHGVVRGRFVVDDLPPELRVGLFAEPGRSYDTVMRFSSLGKPELEVFSDVDRDVRGLGLKLYETGEDGTPVTLWDVLLNAIPILSTRRGRDVVPQRLEFLELTHLLQYSSHLTVPDVFSVKYYSQTPYAYGPGRAVRYTLVPGPAPALEPGADVAAAVDHNAPDHLRRRLEYILAHTTTDVVFDFCVQFQTDPVLDPMEDPRVEWRGPLVKVGELRLPRQIANAPENATHDEALSFHLYYTPQEHAPLGEINRSRRAVYSTSPALRHKLNQHPHGLYPHRPKPLEVCIVGSGVAGQGAALALSRFGHRVTVVERRPRFGGHACSIELPGGHSVDPAFGSFTAAAYPNVARLFRELGVEIEELGSFKEALSYFSRDGLRAWQQIEEIPFARHILDELARFDAWSILADEDLDYVTAREYFAQHGFSEEFIHYVFLGTIIFVFVGHPAEYYLDYPIRQLVKYSYLPVVLAGREPVCRVKHGSASYMDRLTETLKSQGVRMLASTESRILSRQPTSVEIELSGDGNTWRERFDHVILSTQPRAALEVLGESVTAVEREILEAIPFTSDTVVMHRDTRFMPPRREDWRHANMIVADEGEEFGRDRPFMVTKWIKSNGDRETDVFATYAYNRTLDVEGAVRGTFDHVKVTPEVVRLRRRLQAVQGQGRVWFCGSWLRAFTLHEDGLVTGLEAANGILAGLQEYPIIKPAEAAMAKKRSPWGPQHTFLDVIEYQERLRSSKRALVFLDDDCNEADTRTYGELLRGARRIAAALLGEWKVKPGDRVVLVYLPGLDFIEALLGTMLAGALPVPSYPPNPEDLKNDLRKIRAIVDNSGARVALSTREYRRIALLGSALSPTAAFQWPRALTWHTTDDLEGDGNVVIAAARPAPDDTAFLQFTSGSTGDPRGVEITHGNLMHQVALISEAFGFTDESVGCCWVPQYHDLGLVGSIFTALYNGATYVSCSPLSFLRNPAIWGEMMHRYQATATAAPDFGYRLLLSRTTPEQRARWDLSGLRVALSAGEPVHYETLRDFTSGFAASGVEPTTFAPAYGLAEHVVGVSIGGERLFHLDKSELALRNRVRIGDHRVVGCGRPHESVKVAIVDPQTRRRCGADEVGEIWVSSPSKARGYFGQPELSKEIFQARIEGENGNGERDRTWLRTGDLGFLYHGEVFVTGREKDLIILRGRNIYPIDVERSAEGASRSLRPGCSAVFLEKDESERLVLCAELRKGYDEAALPEVAAAVRRGVLKREGLHVDTVALLKARSVPKTTSGKVRRKTCRALWLEGKLKPVFRDDRAASAFRGDAPVRDPGPARVGGTAEDVIHAAVSEVTRTDVDRDKPLADQVSLDSVQFVSLVTLIEQRLQVRLPVTILNRYPSITALAEYLRGRDDVVLPDPSLITLNEGEPGAPTLFLVHPARGGVECFLELARRLDVPITAIRQTEDGASLEALAARYLAAVKTAYPQGPYVFGGYSFGATVAREMALELERRGEVASGVLLIDEIHRSPAPLAASHRSERAALLLEVARESLPAADVAALDAALSRHGEADLEPVLAVLTDPALRKEIAEQIRRYEHNVRLAEAYQASVPRARAALLRAATSYHRAPETIPQVYDVPGDHFTMLQPPHVDAVAAAARQALAAFASEEAPAALPATAEAPVPLPLAPAEPIVPAPVAARVPPPIPPQVSLPRNVGGYGVLAALLAFFLPASLLFPPQRLVRPVKAMLRFMFRVFGWRVRVVGAERLDPNRSYVYMSNHLTAVDHLLALAYLPGYLVGLEKVETLRLPVYGWAARRWGQVHIDRANVESALESWRTIEERLAAGRNVVLYPEGTRSVDGRLQPFKKGVFQIAVNAGAVVVPISLKGPHRLFPPGRALAAKGDVEVWIGQPTAAPAPGPDAADQLSRQVRQDMLSALGEEPAELTPISLGTAPAPMAG